MRIALFIILALTSFLVPYSVFLILAFFYVLMWPGYELFLIAFCIDSFFGYGYHGNFHMLYTLSVGCFIGGALFVRPLLSFYTTERN